MVAEFYRGEIMTSVVKYSFLLAVLCTLVTFGAVKSFAQTFTHSFNFESSSTAYRWYVSAWSTCTNFCSPSNQTRNVDCRDIEGNIVPVADELNDDRCGHTVRPDTTQSCPVFNCIPAGTSFSCPAGTTMTYPGP